MSSNAIETKELEEHALKNDLLFATSAQESCENQEKKSREKDCPSDFTVNRYVKKVQNREGGWERAFEKLLEWYMPLLVSIVIRYNYGKAHFDEALTNVKSKFFEKVLTFDTGKGVRLSSYIYQALRFEVSRTNTELDNAVTIPQDLVSLTKQVKELIDEGENDAKTIAAMVNAELEDVLDAIAISYNKIFSMVHLDGCKNEDDDTTLYNSVSYNEPVFVTGKSEEEIEKEKTRNQVEKELLCKEIMIQKAGMTKTMAERYWEHVFLEVPEVTIAAELHKTKAAISDSIKKGEKKMEAFKAALM